MSNLTEEEQKILERLRKENELNEQISSSERRPVTDPEKYSFPIGLDDEGNPFDELSKDDYDDQK